MKFLETSHTAVEEDDLFFNDEAHWICPEDFGLQLASVRIDTEEAEELIQHKPRSSNQKNGRNTVLL